jgi:hypothetical protein
VSEVFVRVGKEGVTVAAEGVERRPALLAIRFHYFFLFVRLLCPLFYFGLFLSFLSSLLPFTPFVFLSFSFHFASTFSRPC